MAKIGFTKLGLKPNNEIQYIEFNEQTIEVKQYLPVEEKLMYQNYHMILIIFLILLKYLFIPHWKLLKNIQM